ncbi:MAG TPA: EboA domain-containing protein [Fodinibius sp.]|nr:EboA domain-containing protein [Fodinibius sp.]
MKTTKQIRETILTWLETRLDDGAFRSLHSTARQLQEGAEDWLFYSSFSGVPRDTGKAPAELTAEELTVAKQLRSGWDPSRWSLDELGRAALLLSTAAQPKETFFERIENTFISSDNREAVALYQSLPLLPYPEQWSGRAAEGLRTNVTAIFEAVALRNPYPADYLDEDAWNQLVLKALFIGSPLYLIQGIDQRANEHLAHMLVDYAHERWAADRPVSPELWRPVGPFAGDTIVKEDLARVLDHPNPLHQRAALLALAASPATSAKELIDGHGSRLDAMKTNQTDWQSIGKETAAKQ